MNLGQMRIAETSRGTNLHAAGRPALQAGRRWDDAYSRAFSPDYHRAGLQPASNGAQNTVAVRQHHILSISRRGNGNEIIGKFGGADPLCNTANQFL